VSSRFTREQPASFELLRVDYPLDGNQDHRSWSCFGCFAHHSGTWFIDMM